MFGGLVDVNIEFSHQPKSVGALTFRLMNPSYGTIELPADIRIVCEL